MTDISFAAGLVAHIPLLFTDANGNPALAPTGAAVTVDNTGVATAVLANDSQVDVTGLTAGTATLTYTAGAVTGTLTITLTITLTAAGTGTAANVAFDVANATFTPV